MNYWRLKSKAREKLRSEEGKVLSVRRITETETVFGEIKNKSRIQKIPASRLTESKLGSRVAFARPQYAEESSHRHE